MENKIGMLPHSDSFFIAYQCDVGAKALADYRLENKLFLERWEPKRQNDFYSLDDIAAKMESGLFNPGAENALRLGIVSNSTQNLIGLINFTNVTSNPFWACNLGFSVSEKYQGHGYMRAALAVTLPFVFHSFELNRIMANFMPKNSRSARLLQASGFEIEGFAKRYLKINDVWEDHILTSLLNPAQSAV